MDLTKIKLLIFWQHFEAVNYKEITEHDFWVQRSLSLAIGLGFVTTKACKRQINFEQNKVNTVTQKP
jgi:hypothetical protein